MAVTFNDYMPTIWNYFMRSDKIGNEIGVAALMGNLYAESGCTPYACQPSLPYSTCMIYIANVDNHTINEYSFVDRVALVLHNGHTTHASRSYMIFGRTQAVQLVHYQCS